MTEFLSERDPAGENVAKLPAGLVASGTRSGRAWAVRVFRPPASECAVVIEDLFERGTGERGVEPALKRRS